MLVFLGVCACSVYLMCLLHQTHEKEKPQIGTVRRAFSTPFIVHVCVCVCFPGICQPIVCLFTVRLNCVSVKMAFHSHITYYYYHIIHTLRFKLYIFSHLGGVGWGLGCVPGWQGDYKRATVII